MPTVIAPPARLRASLAAALLVFSVGCAETPSAPSAAAAEQPSLSVALNGAASRRPITDEYIVVLRDTVSDVPGQVKRLIAQAAGQHRFTYSSAIKGFAAHMTPRAAAALARHPLVESVEQDQVITADYVTQFPAPWGLDRIDQNNLPLNSGYRYTATAPRVTAYIFDSGLREDHPEWGTRGWNAYNAVDKLWDDCAGHGTHVAGIIGGKTFGVAKQVLLRAIKVLRCDGTGSSSALIAGIDWLRANGRQPAVVNMSLGGSYSSSVNSAVRSLVTAGYFVAVAAGNSNADACKISPAAVAEVMTVAASTRTDHRASFSNWGRCVDIYAPGVDIQSASTYNSTGAMSSGTSQAAPFVTGVAALYKSVYPTATPAEITQWISSQAIGSLPYDNVTGTPSLLLNKGAF